MSKLIKENFSAWINKMPGGDHTLIAIGEAEVPTGGWNGTLKPANPPGINKDILILDVLLTQPSGPVIQIISKINFRYEESPPKNQYTQVTFRHEGEEFTVDVGDTQ